MASGLYCVATVLGSADGEHFHHKEFYQRAKEAGDKRGEESRVLRKKEVVFFITSTKLQKSKVWSRKPGKPSCPDLLPNSPGTHVSLN